MLEREVPFICLSTLGEGGFPESRMLFNLKHFASAEGKTALEGVFAGMEESFCSYIGTNTSSRKTAQIRLDGRACLCYADTAGFRGLSVTGRLAEVFDPAVRRSLWREGWESYYPQGPDDPDFAVFRFTAEKGRYYHGLSVFEFECGAAGQADA